MRDCESAQRALEAFFNPNVSKETFHQANAFLLEWTNSEESWSEALQLLECSSSRLEFKVFAAQTLKRKISLQLTLASPLVLDNLTRVILKSLSPDSNPCKSLAIQLCLCLVHLVIGRRASIEEICNCLVQSTSCLEFLCLLPQEISRTPSSIDLVADNIGSVFNFLIPQSIEETYDWRLQYTSQICSCLLYWINCCPSEALDLRACSKIIAYVFWALSQAQAFNSACETISQLIQKAQENPVFSDLFPLLVYNCSTKALPILASRVNFQSKCSGDDEQEMLSTLWFVSIFAELAKYFISHCLKGAGSSLEPDVERLFTGLSLSMKYSHFRVIQEISCVFEALRDSLLNPNIGKTLRASPLFDSFISPLTFEFVSKLMAALQYPPKYNDWTYSKHLDFDNFRLWSAEALQSCSKILKVQILQYYLEAQFLKNYDDNFAEPWQATDALLFALQHLSDPSLGSERVYSSFPITCLTELASMGELYVSLVSIISNYAPWTASLSFLLDSQMKLLISLHSAPPAALSAYFPPSVKIFDKLASGVCSAVLALSQHCSKQMLDYHEQIIYLYGMYVISDRPEVNSLYKAFVFISRHKIDSKGLNPNKALGLYNQIVGNLHRLLDSTSSSSHKNSFGPCFLRFSTLLQIIPLVQPFISCLPTFKKILALPSSSNANSSVSHEFYQLFSTFLSDLPRESLATHLHELSEFLFEQLVLTQCPDVFTSLRIFVTQFSIEPYSSPCLSLLDSVHGFVLKECLLGDELVWKYNSLVRSCFDYLPDSLYEFDSAKTLLPQFFLYNIQYLNSKSCQSPPILSEILCNFDLALNLLVESCGSSFRGTDYNLVLGPNSALEPSQTIFLALVTCLLKGLRESFPDCIPHSSTLCIFLNLSKLDSSQLLHCISYFINFSSGFSHKVSLLESLKDSNSLSQFLKDISSSY